MFQHRLLLEHGGKCFREIRTCFFSMTLDMCACSAGLIAEKSMAARGRERSEVDSDDV